ncbi:hypothetical protein E2C01_062370 [Portunus trituberculatus]|uniref:Uncharacterized protein n=1 Tax=Portunus trituberculatus TaxID=210409 RepID=A0A5B7HDG2_PORTR|nr:hypothetical protein [Portunus trituberculatus]
MAAVRTQLGAHGVSEEDTEIIMKPGTERQYSPHIKSGVGYESINTARWAPSALGIMVEGCRAGNHPLVKRFLHWVFNLLPSMSRYAATWDMKPVLQRVRTMDPLHSFSLKDLSLKLVTG